MTYLTESELCQRYRLALHKLAALDDHEANAWLKKTGSYGAFDEPGAVQIARKALMIEGDKPT